jgi:hypothetical protein
VLARQAGVVIALTDCVEYSNGFNLGIAVRSQSDLDHRAFGFGPPSDRHRSGTLEVAVGFADGRAATASDNGPSPAVMAYYEAWREGREPEVPTGPIIAMGSGGGGGKRLDFHYWVWPLPPDGPLTISCEWRAGGVALSTIEVDGSGIRRAGTASTSLWD